MSSSYAIYAVSDDDQPVIDAVAGAFVFGGDPDPVYDDGSTVTWTVPGRQVVLWRGDYAEPDISSQPARQVFVWGGGGRIQAALDVIDQLRGHGLDVIIDSAHQDLIAADAARTPAAS